MLCEVAGRDPVAMWRRSPTVVVGEITAAFVGLNCGLWCPLGCSRLTRRLEIGSVESAVVLHDSVMVAVAGATWALLLC